MECVTKHKDAITTDLAGRQIALWLDYHGGYSGYFLYSGSALYSQYQTKMLAYQAGITIFDVNPTSSSTYYADNTLGADLSTPVEASRDLQLTEAEIKTYGSYSIKGLVDLFADGAWPVLLPARLSNSNTFFAPTVTPPNATLTATRFDNTNTFFGPVVNLGGALTLVPTRLDNTNSFFAPIVTPGGTVLQPGIVVNTNSFFAPTVAPGPVTLTPGFSATPTASTAQPSARKARKLWSPAYSAIPAPSTRPPSRVAMYPLEPWTPTASTTAAPCASPTPTAQTPPSPAWASA